LCKKIGRHSAKIVRQDADQKYRPYTMLLSSLKVKNQSRSNRIAFLNRTSEARPNEIALHAPGRPAAKFVIHASATHKSNRGVAAEDGALRETEMLQAGKYVEPGLKPAVVIQCDVRSAANK